MYLEELLELINENTVINIWSNNQELVATYDGRESIPEKYNYCEILDIFADMTSYINCIGIELNIEEDF